jgi:hypothetical protein
MTAKTVLELQHQGNDFFSSVFNPQGLKHFDHDKIAYYFRLNELRPHLSKSDLNRLIKSKFSRVKVSIDSYQLDQLLKSK